MSNAVAKVAFLQGQAWAKSPDGTLRELTVGSVLTADEILVTAQGARVELDLGGNTEPMVVNGGMEVGMSRDFSAETATGADEAFLTDASVQDVLTVLEQGGDLLDELEETAAGNSGGSGSGGGSSFVRLLRISEATDEQSFIYGDLAAREQEPSVIDGQAVNPEEEPAPLPEPEPVPVNSAPVSADQNLTTDEDVALNGQIAATDADGDSLAYAVTGNPTNGTVSLSAATGAFIYTPNANYNGSDAFTVTITDGKGGTTTSTVSIGVTPVNDAPVSTDQNLTTDEDVALTGQIVATDADGDTLAYAITSNASNGTVTLNAATGSFVYTPNANYNGSDAFIVTISDGKGGITTSTVTIGVTPIDEVTVDSITSPAATEGAALIYTVTLTGPAAGEVTLAYNLGGGTASAADYGTPTFSDGVTLVGGNLIIPAGVSSFSVTIPTVDDALNEPTETLPLTIDGVTATGSILDNDAQPSLSIDSVSVNEGAGTATFTVTLSAVSGQTVSVNYASSNGTAIAGSDYTAVTGSLSFAPGETSKTITVNITDDSVFEGNENFTISLSDATNATIVTATGTGTIIDNDAAPTVSSIGSPSVTEGGNLVYSVTLSNTSSTSTTLAYSLGGGTASAADYGTPTFSDGVTLVGGNLIIPAGVSSFSVTIPTVDDALNEPTETLPLTIDGVTATGSILDNDAQPSLSIDSVSVNEGAGTATFTVTLSAVSGQTVSVNYASSNGTAIAGSDYTAVTGSLSFAPGETSKTITVTIAEDTVFEGNENFTISLSDATNATIVTATGTGTIIDNDAAPTVSSIGSPSVTEGGSLVYSVTLSNTSSTSTTLAYSLGGGTASAADYGTPTFSDGVTLVGGTLIIPAGVSSFSVTVATVDDALNEPTETLPLTIGGVTATGRILDNDAQPSLSIDNVSVNEGAGTATFTVTLSAASGQTVSVNYASSNGTATAGSDYTAVTGSLSFAPGETSKTITVTIAEDTVFEGSESFTVSLSSPTNASLSAAATGTGTIIDNDAAPTVSSIGSPSVTEGGNLVYSVTLSNTSSTSTTLAYSLGGGTASAADYGTPTFSDGVTLVGGTLIIPAGVSSFSVTVATVDDALNEPTETLPLTIGGVTATGSILDNDAQPSLSIDNVSVNEGAGTATFTVTLSAVSGQTVSVNYASSNGTAIAGSDYTAVTGSLSFAPGETSKTITVNITDDTVFEGNENFTISLSDATNATIVTATGTGTIIDNDAAPTVSSIGSPSVTEGGSLVYSVTLSNTSSTSTTLAYSLGGGTASAADYGTPTFSDGVTLVGGTLIIPAGVSSFSVTVATVDDALNEPTETLPLTIGGVTSTGRILDNDAQPSLSIDNVSVNEGAGTATFTVTLSAVSGQTVSVNYASSNGTATAGSDYTAVTGSLSFAPGETSKTITVTIADDTVFEGNETFSIDLSNPTNATLGTASGTGTIVDNDMLPNIPPVAVDDPELVFSYTAGVKNGEIKSWDPSVDFIKSVKAFKVLNGVEQEVAYKLNADGVDGAIGVEGAGSSDEIDDEIQGGEYIMVTLDAPVTSASFGFDKLDFDGTPETGLWIAYLNGVEVGRRQFQASDTTRIGTVEIKDTDGNAIAFDQLKFDTAAANSDYIVTWLTVVRTTATVQEGMSIVATATSGVLANDSDTDGGVLTVASVRTGAEADAGTDGAVGVALQGTYGKLTLNADGSYSYAADNVVSLQPGQIAKDYFTYTLSDGQGGTDTATLTISVYGVQTSDNQFYGTAGNDLIVGTSGADLIIGGAGSDDLTGGLGADTFKWSLGDDDLIFGLPSTDIIRDFSQTQGDVLQLSELLQGADGSNLTDYLHFTYDATQNSTTVHISSDGDYKNGYSSGVTDQKIELKSVQLTGTDQDIINLLKSSGNLITD